MSKFNDILNEAKQKSKESNYRVTKRVVYDLEHKDQFGRWMTHSSHDTFEAAHKKIRSAKSEATKSKKYKDDDWHEVGREGPPKNPHGEYY